MIPFALVTTLAEAAAILDVPVADVQAVAHTQVQPFRHAQGYDLWSVRALGRAMGKIPRGPKDMGKVDGDYPVKARVRI
jgi:hypothetical protein